MGIRIYEVFHQDLIELLNHMKDQMLFGIYQILLLLHQYLFQYFLSFTVSE